MSDDWSLAMISRLLGPLVPPIGITACLFCKNLYWAQPFVLRLDSNSVDEVAWGHHNRRLIIVFRMRYLIILLIVNHRILDTMTVGDFYFRNPVDRKDRQGTAKIIFHQKRAPIRDRTEDLFITNEVLYQLSYRSFEKTFFARGHTLSVGVLFHTTHKLHGFYHESWVDD